MKRNFLFMSVLASLFLAGCQEKITPNDGNGEGNTSYMAVNLMSSDGPGNHAAKNYEDGSPNESVIKKVRFYFFTENGAIANVKLLNGRYVNYHDWTPGNGDQNPDGTSGDETESVLSATIVISTKDGDKLPQRIAAVLNPPTTINGNPFLGSESLSLENLKAKVANFADSILTTKGKFVMFNSVYGGDNKTEICAVPIESIHLQKKQSDAKDNPVTIYVERSVAKVSVSFGKMTGLDAQNRLALEDKDGNALKVGGEQVYLKLDGWRLSSESSEGRLVKKIDPNWTSDWWNGTGNEHRSFWAINSKTAQNKRHNYTDIKTPFDTVLYTNENALDNDDKNPINRTKVIIKGSLCKSNGAPFTIVRHLGAHFADTYSDVPKDNLPALKANILSQLSARGYKYYWGTTSSRTQIAISDLKIVIAPQKPNENSKNNCYVYAQLTDEAATKTWYTSSDAANTTTVTPQDINDKLKDKNVLDWALVWRDGMTYYFFEITHHGSGENATKGVVRNHIYKTNITKIAGLGTPVYDPDKVIYPEKPDENDHYIAAEIDILSWRIVENDYELVW